MTNQLERAALPPLSSLPRLVVREFQFHEEPHGDEIAGYAIVLDTPEGDHYFDAKTAALRFVESEVQNTDAYWRSLGIVPIGTGGEQARFNEHLKQGRLLRQCATSLIAKDLGITDNPDVRKLVAETLWADTHGNVPEIQIPSLIKEAYRLGQKSLEVVNWGRQLYEAIIIRERYQTAAVPGEMTLGEIFDAVKSEYKDARAKEYVERKVKDSMGRTQMVTELVYVTSALFRRPYPTAQAFGMVKSLLDLIYNGRVAYQEIKKAIKKSVRTIKIQAMVGSKERTLLLYELLTNDQHAVKAAFDLGADVVFLRHLSSRDVQIFINHKVIGLNLANAARMFRWFEQRKGHKNADWYELGCAGDFPGIPSIHYFKMGQSIFIGGSLTHRGETTLMSRESLLQVLMHAFHPGGVSMWCRKRKIRITHRPTPPTLENAKPVVAQKPPAKTVGTGKPQLALVGPESKKHRQAKKVTVKGRKTQRVDLRKALEEPDAMDVAFDRPRVSKERKRDKTKKTVPAS